jgi:hypothetical protein
MRGGREVFALHPARAGSTVLTALIAAAVTFFFVGADRAAAELIPPKVWTGSIVGFERPPVPAYIDWSGHVRFKLDEYIPSRHAWVYAGTGSVTYTASGSYLGCISSGSQTFPIKPKGAGMSVRRTRTGWRYDIEVDATNNMTVHEDCGEEGGVRDYDHFIDPTIYSVPAERTFPVPRSLSSISNNTRDGGYRVHWELSGTPRHSDRQLRR